MSNSKDISPHIRFPLPETVPPTSIKNALPEHIYKEVRSTLEALDWGPGSSEKYHSIASRWLKNVTFTKEIDDVFLDLAKKHFQDENLKLSFYYTSRYQIHEGNIPYLWEHIDQNGTQHTIDLCVIKHNLDDWGIYVEGKLFSEEENQAVFMSASQQIHSRPPYPSRDPEAYIVLLFAVYTKEGHWWRQLDGSQESFLEAIEKYRWDGDIRYYEQKGHVAYFNDIPKENKPCNSNYPNECLDCWVAPEELIKEKMKINKEINESKP
jgi:hypothetical protein